MIITLEHIQCVLVIGFILGIVIIIVGYMDMKRKSNKIMEGFSDSPHFPEAHNSLLLDSIFERDKSGVFKTFKNQIVNLPVSCVGSYNQKTNNPRDLSP